MVLVVSVVIVIVMTDLRHAVCINIIIIIIIHEESMTISTTVDAALPKKRFIKVMRPVRSNKTMHHLSLEKTTVLFQVQVP